MGSVYLADQKLPINRPRVRNRIVKQEVPLASYALLQQPRRADEGVLKRVLRGLSCREYEDSAEAVPEAFGWKSPRKFQRMLSRSDYKGREANRVWVKMNKWQSVNRREVRCVMKLQWFRRQGLTFLSDFIQRQLPLELKFSR